MEFANEKTLSIGNVTTFSIRDLLLLSFKSSLYI